MIISVSFTQKKAIDKYIYFSSSLMLYDEENGEVGATNLVLFKGWQWAWLRADLHRGSCSKQELITKLEGVAHTMRNVLGSHSQFRLKVQGGRVEHLSMKELMGPKRTKAGWKR